MLIGTKFSPNTLSSKAASSLVFTSISRAAGPKIANTQQALWTNPKRWFSVKPSCVQSKSVGRLGGQQNRYGRGGSNIPPYIYLGIIIPVAGGVYVYYKYSDTVPVTGRSRWIVTTPETEIQLGDKEYQQLLQQFRGKVLPDDHRASITVKRVGSRIAQAATEFAIEHDLPYANNNSVSNDIVTTAVKRSSNNNPTYTVVKSDMANAFVLPGNHIFVMTGLFQYAQNEDELAAVIGHEMAHTLARHAGERISGSLVRQVLAGISLLFDPSGALLAILLPASSLLLDLPHSRLQELEADQIGLYLSAKACYDPRAAKRVFGRMKADAANEGKRTPAFLSTHPSHDQRLEKFDEWIPEVMKGQDTEHCRRIRQQMKKDRRFAAISAAEREQMTSDRSWLDR